MFGKFCNLIFEKTMLLTLMESVDHMYGDRKGHSVGLSIENNAVWLVLRAK